MKTKTRDKINVALAIAVITGTASLQSCQKNEVKSETVKMIRGYK